MQRNVCRSFEEVTFAEAAGRRLPVELFLRPRLPNAAPRLRSQFVGQLEDGNPVLAIPQDLDGRKVCVPRGHHLELAFELEGLWVQAPTRVIDRRLFPPHEDAARLEAPAQAPQSRASTVRRIASCLP